MNFDIKENSDLQIVEYLPVHWPELDNFWRNIPEKPWDDRARALWQWLQPRRKHYLAFSKGDLVANATLLNQEFLSQAGERMSVSWITDFFAMPVVQRRGIGQNLIKCFEKDAGVSAIFGGTEASRRFFSRLDWDGPHWRPLFGKVFSVATSITCRTSIKWVQAEFVDPRIDVIWSQREINKTSIGIRDSTTLNSRFHGRPDARYELWIAEQGEKPVGWVILRLIRGRWHPTFKGLPAGLLIDIFSSNGNNKLLGELANFGVRRLSRQGALIVLAVGADENIVRALRECGFCSQLKVGPFKLKHLSPQSFMVERMEGVARLGTRPYLSFFDGDADFVI